MKLQFSPGVNREITGYANEGGWWDIDKVRFRMGLPEKIGGWTKFSPAYFLGTCRFIVPWVALDANQYVGFGTNLKFYVYGSGVYNDITPIRATTAAGDVTFAVGYTTLNGAIDDSQRTITLASVTNFPTTGGRIKIDNEVMTYATVSGSTLGGIVRGVDGTTAASHSNGAAVSSASIIVTDTAHGAYQNDFVTFSGATSLGGNMTAAVLNQEYQIDAILTLSTYVISARTVSTVSSITTTDGLDPTYVFSAAGDSGTGGAATVGAYQITAGLNTSISGTGWGAGPYGGIGTGGTSSPPTTTGWGDPATVTVPGAQLRLWGGDNYGQDLIFNVRDGGIYYWAKNTNYPRAVALSDLPGASFAPTLAKQVIISDADRHVVAFGCDDEFSPGVMDPLLIRFSTQENAADWQSLPTNSAGSLRLGTGSEIVCAVETKQQTVVITDVSVHAMRYLGPPYTFGIDMLSDNISIIGPNAAVSVDDAVFWMGQGDFFAYDGVVSQLPCTVKDYVFSDINLDQTTKVACGVNQNFNEVWWFYPSADSTENDRYVVFNYQQKLWYFGTMTRSAWTHKNTGIYPLATGLDHAAYLHEDGFDDGSTFPATPITAYIESSGQDIGDGNQFSFITRVLPDVTFRDSPNTPELTMTVKMSNFPGANFSQSNARDVIRTATYPVEQYTNQVFTRLRGRTFAVRVESDQLGVAWRFGHPRIDVRTDGRR
jgi:hypothetical protein